MEGFLYICPEVSAAYSQKNILNMDWTDGIFYMESDGKSGDNLILGIHIAWKYISMY